MRLDRRIVIQNFTTSKNDFGEDVKTWNITLATVWAKIENKLIGAEVEESREVVAINVKFFWIRYLSTVTETMRIVWDNENYYIESIAEMGRRKWMKIKAEKRDNE